MIEITKPAQEKIIEILSEENDANSFLRMFIQGGGCSGFTYGFTIDSDETDEDIAIEIGPKKIVVDVVSLQYLQGSVVDYKDDLNGSRFSITNPIATSTCGCGNSFNV